MTDIVGTVRDRLQESWEHDQDNRRDAASDLQFLAGDQWDATARRLREEEDRPTLTVNRLPQFVNQVVNDIKQADLAIKVSPVDDRSDPDLADVFNGLFRQIQYQSSAKHVYGRAVKHQVACGIGHWRVTTEYVDDEAFEQEIKLKPIPQPLSVYWDPAASEPDRSDAAWCIVTETIPKEAFKETWPDAAEESVSTNQDHSSDILWSTADEVRIAEYWERVPVRRKLALLQNGQTIDITDIPPAQLGGAPIHRVRDAVSFKVRQRLVSGSEELTAATDWAGKWIPIIPLIGDEIPLDKKVFRCGLVRFARDPQVLYNYYRSAVTEWIGLGPKAPYLLETEMIADNAMKARWDTANTKAWPWLAYKRTPSGATPTRVAPPEMPAALFQEGSIAADDMKATTGIYDGSLGAKSNETSGRAIMARDRQGDTANYHYADNLERSLWHTGRIILDLIPKVYDTERVVRLLGEDESEKLVKLNSVGPGPNGLPMVLNDVSAARFDVRVSIGRSYATKRQESAESMMAFLQAFPPAAPVIGDLVAKAQDWPGSDEIAKRLKNMVPPQALQDPDNPQPPPPAPPNPMMQLELQEKQFEVKKKKADADSARFDAALKLRGLMQPPAPPAEPGASNGASPAQ